MKEQSLRLYRFTFLKSVKNPSHMPSSAGVQSDFWFSWKLCKSRQNITHWLRAWDSLVCCLFYWVHKISCGHETWQNDVYFEQKYTIILFIKQKPLSKKIQLMIFLQRNTARGPQCTFGWTVFSVSFPSSFKRMVSCSISGMHGKAT